MHFCFLLPVKAMRCLSFVLLLLSVSSSSLFGQDSLATVYFYWPPKSAGASYYYDVKCGSELVGRIQRGKTLEYRCKPGFRIFTATTESEAAFKITLKAREDYFIECGNAVGTTVGRPTFREAAKQEALVVIAAIDKELIDSNPNLAPRARNSSDTTVAVAHLFKRKRGGGTARGVVFGIFALSALMNTINYSPTTVTINQGPSGTQTIPIDSSPPAGNYIGIGLFAGLSISGFHQLSTYSIKNQDAILQRYNAGQPLPEKIISKLKEKDFK